MDLFDKIASTVITLENEYSCTLYNVDDRYLIRIVDNNNLTAYDKYFDKFIDVSAYYQDILETSHINFSEFTELFN